MRFKDRFWVKQIKWFSYKRYQVPGRWHTRFELDKALRGLDENDLIIDCGANVGKYTALFAATGATVHAFEPDPYSFEKLRENTKDLSSVHIHNVAVGAQAGEVDLYRAVDFESDPDVRSLSTSIFSDKSNVSGEKGISVAQIDLIDFVLKLGKPVSITKIDIEGAEIPLLEAIIDRDCVDMFGLIFAETHETRIPSLEERTRLLRTTCRERYRERIFLDWE